MRTEHFSFLGLLVTVTGVSAIEPAQLFAVQKGPMLLKPQLNTGISFNDNINYRETDKVSDFYATISPGIEVQFGTRDYNYLDFSYFYDRLQYFQENQFDANQHRFAMNSKFELSRFTLEGQDQIEFLSSPIGGGVSLEGQTVDRMVYLDNYRLTYRLTERTGVYGDLTHRSADYDEGTPLYDSFSLIGTAGFQYRGFSRTFFFGEVYYGVTQSSYNQPTAVEYPDARYIGGFLGARGYFTEKLTGTLKAGYETRDYSDESEGTSAPVVEAAMTYKVREATTAYLAYARRQYESVQFIRTTYVTDSFTANVQQEIGADGRLKADLRASYSLSSYDDSALFSTRRQDQLVFSGLTISYDVKLWMRIFGGYSFEWLDSTEPSIVDYVVNRFTAGLQFGY